ncbi:NAD(P)-binding domain-containing protein [Kitasatospora sp. NPDC049258]|uniref:NAD(P)-binding domain-containing protein n=1 Tax=Kitasatospora sp. NPDC049258 TaxID=3155394 RepID=UPI00342B7E31
MQLGVIGLGRMGTNIARRLMRDGHTCVVYDVNPAAVAALEKDGACTTRTPASATPTRTPRRRRWSSPSTTGTTSTPPRSPRSGGAAA